MSTSVGKTDLTPLSPTPIALAVRMAVLYPDAWAIDLGADWQKFVVEAA